MSDEDLFLALVIAATAAGHPDPLTRADDILTNLKTLRIMRARK